MLQQKFMDAIIHNRIEEVKYFITYTDINPAINRQEPLKKAAHYGYSEIISILSSDDRVKIDYQENIILKMAFQQNHIDTCELILEIYMEKLKEPAIFSKNALSMCIYLEYKDLFFILLKKNTYSYSEIEDTIIATQFFNDKWAILALINKVDLDKYWVLKNISNKKYQKFILSYIKFNNF